MLFKNIVFASLLSLGICNETFSAAARPQRSFVNFPLSLFGIRPLTPPAGSKEVPVEREDLIATLNYCDNNGRWWRDLDTCLHATRKTYYRNVNGYWDSY